MENVIFTNVRDIKKNILSGFKNVERKDEEVFEKARVKAHTRKTKSGKLSQVKEYDNRKRKYVNEIVRGKIKDLRETVTRWHGTVKKEIIDGKELYYNVSGQLVGEKDAKGNTWYVRFKKQDSRQKKNKQEIKVISYENKSGGEFHKINGDLYKVTHYSGGTSLRKVASNRGVPSDYKRVKPDKEFAKKILHNFNKVYKGEKHIPSMKY